MVQKIVETKNPILREKSKPVRKIDKKIKVLAKDLLDTIRAQKDPEGVGLAAVQIGKPLRMFAMLWKKSFRIIINPEIVKIVKTSRAKNKGTNSKKTHHNTILEGCLSIPNIYGPLQRPQKIILKFTGLDGEETTEVFEGFSAQIIQHEIDHLNGTLFTDILLKEKAPFYKFDTKNDDWEEMELT